MLKKIRRFAENESGAAQLVEAAIIYPVVFMCIIFLIYVGLYILVIKQAEYKIWINANKAE